MAVDGGGWTPTGSRFLSGSGEHGDVARWVMMRRRIQSSRRGRRRREELDGGGRRWDAGWVMKLKPAPPCPRTKPARTRGLHTRRPGKAVCEAAKWAPGKQ
nr:unnamed protein product [Digitaria exilis]